MTNDVKKMIDKYFVNKRFEIKEWIFCPKTVTFSKDRTTLFVVIVKWGDVTDADALAAAMEILLSKLLYFGVPKEKRKILFL